MRPSIDRQHQAAAGGGRARAAHAGRHGGDHGQDVQPRQPHAGASLCHACAAACCWRVSRLCTALHASLGVCALARRHTSAHPIHHLHTPPITRITPWSHHGHTSHNRATSTASQTAWPRSRASWTLPPRHSSTQRCESAHSACARAMHARCLLLLRAAGARLPHTRPCHSAPAVGLRTH
jgi:hypothetical protein